MPDETKLENLVTDNIVKFLNQNKEVDFLVCNLQDEKIVSKFNYQNIKQKQNELMFQIKAYQRVIRIIPVEKSQSEENRQIALILMQQGIHSALQITAMTRRDFLELCANLFSSNQELSASIYQKAQEKRSVILIQYMNILQNGEPHISAARFN